MYELGGGRCAKGIIPPRQVYLALDIFWKGLKVSFQAFHVWSAFGFPSHSVKLLGKELARRREDVAKAAIQFSVIDRPPRFAFFCASSIDMMY